MTCILWIIKDHGFSWKPYLLFYWRKKVIYIWDGLRVNKLAKLNFWVNNLSLQLFKGPLGFLWDCDIINGDHCDLYDASSAVVHLFAGPCSGLSVASGLQYGGTRNQPENLVQEPDGAGLPCADGHQRHRQPGTCTTVTAVGTVTDWWNWCCHVKNL